MLKFIRKCGNKKSGRRPHFICVRKRTFSHSRPITRPFGAPSSDKEGSRCGGSAALLYRFATFSHSRPIIRRFAPLATVHRKVASDKEGLICVGFHFLSHRKVQKEIHPA